MLRALGPFVLVVKFLLNQKHERLFRYTHIYTTVPTNYLIKSLEIYNRNTDNIVGCIQSRKYISLICLKGKTRTNGNCNLDTF